MRNVRVTEQPAGIIAPGGLSPRRRLITRPKSTVPVMLSIFSNRSASERPVTLGVYLLFVSVKQRECFCAEPTKSA
jgi:hypothetical protein